MEAIGQLAGGIAHDFNNLLNIIQGNLELVLERVSSDPELHTMTREALRAVDRGSGLTRQLLAYSRRQPLAPVELSLNALVAGLATLLRRTLGEAIQITTRLPGSLWMTRIDPNQLENALINLAVNARDAMPSGGALLIEGQNVALDQAQAEQLVDVAPGRYVCLAVTDSGIGMSREVAARALEPFFTTKPAGQGTGLGLSMVFGFVKQSDGAAPRCGSICRRSGRRWRTRRSRWWPHRCRSPGQPSSCWWSRTTRWCASSVRACSRASAIARWKPRTDRPPCRSWTAATTWRSCSPT
jgi:signal transduction histidine kinase